MRKISPAAVTRTIQESAARATTDYIMSPEFTKRIISEITSELSDRIVTHPNLTKLVRSEVSAAMPQEPLAGTALAAIEKKTKTIRSWLIFFALLGVGTYAGVMLIRAIFGNPER